jgi:hypothetical protein
MQILPREHCKKCARVVYSTKKEEKNQRKTKNPPQPEPLGASRRPDPPERFFPKHPNRPG